MFISLLATFGLSILLQQLMNQIWGGDVRTAQSGLGTWFLLDYTVTVSQMKAAACGGAIVIGVVLIVFLKKSRIGQAIRATAQNPRAARILGIDTNRVFAATYGINAALCGAAGALVVMAYSVHPYIGLPYTVRSFMIVIVAGLGNLPGVIVAGLGPGRGGELRGLHPGRAVSGGLRLHPAGGDPRDPQLPAAAAQAVPQVTLRRQPLLMLGVAAAGRRASLPGARLQGADRDALGARSSWPRPGTSPAAKPATTALATSSSSASACTPRSSCSGTWGSITSPASSSAWWWGRESPLRSPCCWAR